MADLPAPPSSPAAHRLAYGPHPLHFGDLRLPVGTGPHPVLIAAHGGFWREQYDLAYLGALCAALTAEGYATWSLSYRRIGHGGGGYPGTLQDVALGADHLTTLAKTLPLDLTRVGAIGHSAGGQLALWLSGRHLLPKRSVLFTERPLSLKGVVSLGGVCDLGRAAELRLGNGVVATFLGGLPGEVPEAYASASPLELLPTGARAVLVHGTLDAEVPLELSERYVVRARSLGDRATLDPLVGIGHYEPVRPAGPAWEAVRAAVRIAMA